MQRTNRPLNLGRQPELEALQIRPEDELTRELEENLIPATEVTLNTSSSVMKVGQQLAIESAVGGTPVRARFRKRSMRRPFRLAMSASGRSSKDRHRRAFGAPGTGGRSTTTTGLRSHHAGNSHDADEEQSARGLAVRPIGEHEGRSAGVRDRIEKVYTELGLTDAAKETPYRRGQLRRSDDANPQANVRPGHHRAAIDAVKGDPSGKMMCDSVGMTVTALQSVATSTRQLAMILVTDESGERDSNEGD
jgi:hypothetical protein